MIQYNDKSYVGLSVYYHINVFFRRIELILFLIVSLILIFGSKMDNKLSRNISEFFVDVSIPIMNFGSAPFKMAADVVTNFEELSNARNQNKILRAENDELRSIYIKALDIKRENDEMKALLKFVEINSTNYKSTKLIASSNTLYKNNVFIYGGKNDNIKQDSVVVGRTAMIGRVSSVGETKSKVMLITDVNSRVPVITSETGNRAILAGNNGEFMEMIYLGKNHNIKTGELVFTSGDDGYLPSGLLVGIVTKSTSRTALVKMAENIANTNMVSVIEY